ncbi:MAG: tRNA (adenosine(37)-N6)-threonylcarbamoyltransferase complex transferase subunit TsaD [Candidatus Gracilibacteria bacterium]
MRILAVESSCDDMSWAVVKDGTDVESCHVFSQADLHAVTGGVVPEVAAREHVRQAIPSLRAMGEAIGGFQNIDAIAMTQGPGLLGSLIVGISTAQTLALFLGKPLIPVHHIEGHIYANWLERDKDEIKFPLVVLTVSGGHNDLYYMKDFFSYELIGHSLDDAAGEAFDKVARILELGYPGGPAIEKFLKESEGLSIRRHLPRALKQKGNHHFSFSGLKSDVKRHVQLLKDEGTFTVEERIDIAAAFQESVVEVLAEKLFDAAKYMNAQSVCVSGGVSANNALKEYMLTHAHKHGFQEEQIFFPMKKLYSTDNAAMIGAAAYYVAERKPEKILDTPEKIMGVSPLLVYTVGNDA